MKKLIPNILTIVIIASIFFIGGLALHDAIFPPRTITIDTTFWEVQRLWEQITQSSEIIARTLHDFKPRPVYIAGDTIWIYDTTQAQNIPLQLYSECHNVPLLVNNDTNYIPIHVDMQYQLVDWIKVYTKPMPHKIVVKQRQKVVRFFGYGAVAVNSQKRLQSEIRCGVHIGEHLFIYGGSRLDSQLEAVAEAGVGWKL